MSKFDKNINRGSNDGLVTRTVGAGDLVDGWAQVSLVGILGAGLIIGYRVINQSGADLEHELHMAFAETNDVASDSMEGRDDHSGTLSADGDTGRVNVSDDHARGVVLRVNGAAYIELSVVR